ncbi:MAG: hydroxyacid dehydrogenase [Pseudomonadota bacterium]
MSFTIFVTAPRLAAAGLRILEEADCNVLFLPEGAGAREAEAIMASNAVDAVISRTATLTAAAIGASPRLRVISKHGVGVSNIDVSAATAQGIPVYVTPGANAQSVTELTVGLMIAAARRIALLDREMRAGRWTRAQDGVQLCGKRLGLVGFGQVGQRVARVAQALGMQVHAHDPMLKGACPVEGVTLHAQLEAMLPMCDVLSLHIPLTGKTRNLIDANALDLLPHGAILINTARGEVIDETALIERLKSGRLAGAGLDTMSEEPLPAGHSLASLPTVILTPHVGGSTEAALETMAEGAARNVLGWLNGKPPERASCVNPEVLPSLQLA